MHHPLNSTSPLHAFCHSPDTVYLRLYKMNSEVDLQDMLRQHSSTATDAEGFLKEERLVGEIARPVVARIRR